MKKSFYASAVVTLCVSLFAPMATAVVAADAPPSSPTIGQTDSLTTADVKQVLQSDPALLSDSSSVHTTSDADSAATAVTTGSTVDVPKDASDGVALDAANGGPSLDISLPNADNAGAGKQVAPGVVAYPSDNGSANAVQTNAQGVKMLTIIDSPNAPTTYDYNISVPNGGSVKLTSDGGAVILDNTRQPIATVAAPWAHDAKGKLVKTYFTTNGLMLTQHIKHNAAGIAYPITADPQISFGWYIYVRLSPQDQGFVMQAAPSVVGAFVCGALTENPRMASACAAAGSVFKDWVGVYYKAHRWVEFRFTYSGFLAGVKLL